MKKSSRKYYVVGSWVILFLLSILLSTIYILPVHAQLCGGGAQPRAEGLVSSLNLTGKFSASVCQVDPNALLLPYKIPTYDDLLAQYFTQSKATKQTITQLSAIVDQTAYRVQGDLQVSSNPTGSGAGIIFVDGSLGISSDITYGSSGNSGLVFVVRKNIYIDPSVTTINAVLISSGSIYSAASFNTICNTSSVKLKADGSAISALTINGSIISLDANFPIKFCRSLSNNASPAEQVNLEPKYLVILRNLLSTSTTKWAEVDTTVPAPTPGSAPTFPFVTTQSASAITGTSATLNSTVNTNGSPTTAWYRWSAANTGNCATLASETTPHNSLTGSAATNPVTISGLTNGATYYFCAVANNAGGTTYGSILTFNSVNPPTVITQDATLVTATSYTLNGLVNPNGYVTTAWYRYSTTSGSCSSTFGSATSSQSVGSGTTSVSNPQTLSGLSLGTTYYFCLVASSSSGTSYGSVLSFTTPTPPTITTNAASSISGASTTLNGTVNPNGSATTGWFLLSTTNSGSCATLDITQRGNQSVGSGTLATSFSVGLAGLAYTTTYYYCAVASNIAGTVYGSILSFTTLPPPPTAGTKYPWNPSTLLQTPNYGSTYSSILLNGQVNPNGSATTYGYRWGATNIACSSLPNYLGGGSLPAVNTLYDNLGNLTLSGLASNTTYYYCISATNAGGTTDGSVLPGATLAAPPTITYPVPAVSSITANSAVITINVNFDGSKSLDNTWVYYGISNTGNCATLGSSVAGPIYNSASGTYTTTNPTTLSGLAAGTNYYYCGVASNESGTSYGAIQGPFTTNPVAPTVTTTAAGAVTWDSVAHGYSVPLNATVNPGGGSTTVKWRYSTSSGNCNSSFGTQTGGSVIISGNTNQNVSLTITGLSPSITYYFCAEAFNSASDNPVYSNPTAGPNNYTVDNCLYWGSSCGQPAANQYCQNQGSSSASNYQIISTSPTYVLGTGQVCTSGCGGFSQITCSGGPHIYANNVLSFITPGAPIPDATTLTPAIGAVTGSGGTVTFKSTVNPNNSTTSLYYNYGLSNVGCGSMTSNSGGLNGLTGNLDISPNAMTFSGLTANRTWYYCVVATSATGTRYGNVVSFFIPGAPPYVTTNYPWNGTGQQVNYGSTYQSIQLNSSINPNEFGTTFGYRWGSTSAACSLLPNYVAGGFNGGSLPAIDFLYTNGSLRQDLSGLASSTTYYYCVQATNVNGTSYGGVFSGTTAAPAPTITYPTGATSVGSTTATLNGTADYHGSGNGGLGPYDQYWFYFGTNSAAGCSASLGNTTSTGVPGGGPLYAVALSYPAGGLSPGTTYYYCLVAQNAEGLTTYGNGILQQFTTPAAAPVFSGTPTASPLYWNSGTFNATVNPGGATTTVTFRYNTGGGTCNSTFVGTVGANLTTIGGAGVNSNLAASVTTGAIFSGSTSYYFCVEATNSAGTAYSGPYLFTTPAPPPPSATANTQGTATWDGSSSFNVPLNSTINPNGSSTTYYYNYGNNDWGGCGHYGGPGSSLANPTNTGTFGPISGTLNSSPNSVTIVGLNPSTSYLFCVIATNSSGTTYSNTVTFATPPGPPSVTTGLATGVTYNSAYLNATINPNGYASTYWWRWSTTVPARGDLSYTNCPTLVNETTHNSLPSVSVSTYFSGLSPSTRYYFCAAANNINGTSYGSISYFDTTPPPPTVTTGSATNVSYTTATLNGTFSSPYSSYAHFLYGVGNACQGSVANGIPYNYLGTVSSSADISGLSPGTTYYFCGFSDNAFGTNYGSPVPFATLNCTMTTYYQDADGDGYGNPNVSVFTCPQPVGYVANNLDCGDGNSSAHPGAGYYGNTFITNSGASSWDWDCSGAATTQYSNYSNFAPVNQYVYPGCAIQSISSGNNLPGACGAVSAAYAYGGNSITTIGTVGAYVATCNSSGTVGVVGAAASSVANTVACH